jgi:hypothetical protein
VTPCSRTSVPRLPYWYICLPRKKITASLFLIAGFLEREREREFLERLVMRNGKIKWVWRP